MADATVLFRGEFHSEAQRLLAATDPRPVLDEMGNMKVSRLVRGMTRGGGESIPGLPPVNRSGAFRARFSYEVRGEDTLRYGNSSTQARILELGGQIVPKNKEWLTVPIDPAAVGKRASDFSPRLIRIGRVLYQPRQHGRGQGKWGSLQPMFLLCKSVLILRHPAGLEWDSVDAKALETSLKRRLREAR